MLKYLISYKKNVNHVKVNVIVAHLLLIVHLVTQL